MEQVSLKALLEAGCHFGHKADRWHPKAHTFIYQKREGIHIIDLAKTKSGLEAAAGFIKNEAAAGRTVLFIGTKRQASAILKEEAEKAGAAYMNKRWVGGFLTNWETVHKNLEKIRRLKDEERNDLWKKYPKHERVKLGRYVRKLEQFYGGVLALNELPSSIFVVDIKREEVAVNEAVKMGIPIVAVVDTNTDPTPVNWQIPANDDAVGSIKFIVTYIGQAYHEGKDQFDKEQASEAAKVKASASVAEKVTEVNQEKPKAEMTEKVAEKKQAEIKLAAKPVETKPELKLKKRGRPKKVK